jgi:hypothetical protein
MERGQSGPEQRGAAGLHIGRLYNSVPVTWKKGGREPLGFTSRQASILALIIWPTSTSKISPFCGESPLCSVKRRRDPSRQVIVISHVAIEPKCRLIPARGAREAVWLHFIRHSTRAIALLESPARSCNRAFHVSR